MLQDKDFATDLLDISKHQSIGYTRAGTESSHPQIRQTFLDFAQKSLQEQWKLYELSEQKGWYLPAGEASPQDVQTVQQFFQPAVKKLQNAQPAMV